MRFPRGATLRLAGACLMAGVSCHVPPRTGPVPVEGSRSDLSALAGTWTGHIAVVRIKQRKIRGILAPYWDPDCDCRARTIFEGELLDHHIAGTFTSRRDADSVPVTGSWFVNRRPN